MNAEDAEAKAMEDNFRTLIEKSKIEMLHSLNSKCNEDIVLDLDNEDKEILRGFLLKLEQRATLIDEHLVNHHLSLLHKTEDKVMIPQIFVQVNSQKIELCISANKLYFYGFKVHGSTYEAIEETRKMDDSISLNFGVDYDGLGVDLDRMNFGYYSIRKAAFNFLKWPSKRVISHLKSAFGVMIVMISESLRFNTVKNHVLGYYEKGNDGCWKGLHKTVKNWQNTCNRYYVYRHYKRGRLNRISFEDNQLIRNRFPSLINHLSMSPPPPPQLSMVAYHKEVSNILNKVRSDDLREPA